MGDVACADPLAQHEWHPLSAAAQAGDGNLAQGTEDLLRVLGAILDAAVKVREQGWSAAAHLDNVLQSQAAALAKTYELSGVNQVLGVDVMRACLEWDHAYKQTLERGRDQLDNSQELVLAEKLASRVDSLLIFLQSSGQGVTGGCT